MFSKLVNWITGSDNTTPVDSPSIPEARRTQAPATAAAAAASTQSPGEPVSLQNLRVYAWGFNDDGRLGLGATSEERTIPMPTTGLLGDVSFVSAGRRHTAVLNSEGGMFWFGQGVHSTKGNQSYFGGVPTPLRLVTQHISETDNVKFVACGQDLTIVGVEHPDGSVEIHSLTSGSATPIYTFTAVQGVKQIVCRTTTVLVLTEDGVYSMGGNGSFQTGHPQLTSSIRNFEPVQALRQLRIVQISGGGYHSLALADDGTIWAFGANDYGQCGQGTVGKAIAQPTMIKHLKDQQIALIASGVSHNVAVSIDGKAYAWGRNADGQCGVRSTTATPLPTLLPDTDKEHIFYATAGFGMTYCIALSGKVFYWGKVWNGDYSGVSKFFEDKKMFIHQLWAGHYHVTSLVGTSPKFFLSPSTLAFDMQKLFASNPNKDVCLELDGNKHIWCHSFLLLTFAPGLWRKAAAEAERRDGKYYLSLSKEDPVVIELVVKYVYHFSADLAVALVPKLSTFLAQYDISTLDQLVKRKMAIVSAAPKTARPAPAGAPPAQDSIWLHLTHDTHSTLFEHLLLSNPAETQTDILLTVADESGDRREFRVHKALLSARSEYFRGFFDSGLSESHSLTATLQASPTAFATILHFIYTDTAILTGDTAVEVMTLAHEYLLQRLADEAEAFVASNLAADTVVNLLAIANAIDAKQLRRSCLYFLHKEHPVNFRSLPGFDDLPQALRDELDAFLRPAAK